MAKFFIILAAILNAIMITVGIAMVAVGVQTAIGLLLIAIGIPIVFVLRKKLMQLNQLKRESDGATGTVVAVGMGTLGNEEISDNADTNFGT